MRRFFVIIAKSGSGKDTLYHTLRNNKELPLKTFVLYYTRPKRVGEVDGETYRFISNEEMDKLMKSGKVIANDHYPTHYGGCDVAFVDDDQIEKDGDYLGVMSLKFYTAFERFCMGKSDIELVPIFIYVSARDRIARSLAREEKEANPNYKELLRRFVADEDDFKEEVLNRIPKTNVFANDNLENFINEVTTFVDNKIHNYNTTSRSHLKQLLLDANKTGKAYIEARNTLLSIFRKDNSYEELLCDLLSYCECGELMDKFGKDIDNMVSRLYDSLIMAKVDDDIIESIEPEKFTSTSNFTLCSDTINGKKYVCLDLVYDNSKNATICDTVNLFAAEYGDANIAFARDMLNIFCEKFNLSFNILI